MIGRNRTRRWKIQRRELSQHQLLGIVVVLNSAAIVVLAAFEASLGVALGVLGLVVAIAGIGMQEIRVWVRRPRKILFLSSSDSWFSHQIWMGLSEGLDGLLSHQLSRVKVPGHLAEQGVDGQLAALREPETGAADAIVIRPAGITDRLTDELARHARAGTVIVFVNSCPSFDQWDGGGYPLPMFVGCDMAAGGQLVGNLVSQVAERVQADGIILIEGPDAKRSNAVRTAWAARAVTSLATDVPCVTETVSRFGEREIMAGVASAIRRLDRRAGRSVERIVLYPGTDRAATIFGRRIADNRHLEGHDRRVWMVSFDGLRHPDGSALVADVAGVVATVDQQPYTLGREAAAHVVAAFHGRQATRRREVVVAPKVLEIVERGEVEALGGTGGRAGDA
jgi:hypothetical protein